MWCVFLVDISFLLTVKHDPTDKDDKIAIIMMFLHLLCTCICLSVCCSFRLLSSVCWLREKKTFCECLHFVSSMFKWTDFVVLLNFFVFSLSLSPHVYGSAYLTSPEVVVLIETYYGQMLWLHSRSLAAHCIPSSPHKTQISTHDTYYAIYVKTSATKEKKNRHKWRWLKLSRK